MKKGLWSIALGLFGLASALPADPAQEAAAGIDDSAKATYFVLASLGYVFALNVVENGDVYYHMNAPSTHSWVGIGFGGSMINTRMLISYLASNGGNLTNSCRLSYGNSEPVLDPDCKIDNVRTDQYAPYANTISPDGILIAHAVCRNCSVWKGGSIDMTDTAQQFVFALGPNVTLKSDDPAANLRMHQFHGVFQMDMTKASNTTGDYGRVPAPQDPALQVGSAFWAFANYYSSTDYGTGNDSEWAPLAHGVIMCLAFVLVFPVGTISLRLMKRVFIHAAAQVIGLVFVIAGFGIGVYVSKIYNKSKNFTSTHQILGLLIFAAIFLQLGLGLLHHTIYLRSGSPSILGTIHRFLGLGIIVLGLANAGIGFNFAGNSAANLPYGIVVGLVFALFAGFFVLVLYWNSRNVYRPEKAHILPSAAEQYGQEAPDEYEMQHAPFARMGHVPTPRTPHFGQQQYRDEDDPEDYRAYVQQQKNQMARDTPAEERGDPFGARMQVPGGGGGAIRL